MKKQEGLRETIKELEGLSAEEGEHLTKSIRGLTADTPKTGTAMYRVKKAMGEAGAFGADVLRNVLVKVATAEARRQLEI